MVGIPTLTTTIAAAAAAAVLVMPALSFDIDGQC